MAYSLFFQGIAGYMPERPAGAAIPVRSMLSSSSFFSKGEDRRIEY